MNAGCKCSNLRKPLCYLVGVLLNCGPTNEIVTTNLKFITDEGFISVGNTSTLNTPDLLSILSTLRYFSRQVSKEVQLHDSGD